MNLSGFKQEVNILKYIMILLFILACIAVFIKNSIPKANFAIKIDGKILYTDKFEVNNNVIDFTSKDGVRHYYAIEQLQDIRRIGNIEIQ